MGAVEAADSKAHHTIKSGKAAVCNEGAICAAQQANGTESRKTGIKLSSTFYKRWRVIEVSVSRVLGAAKYRRQSREPTESADETQSPTTLRTHKRRKHYGIQDPRIYGLAL